MWDKCREITEWIGGDALASGRWNDARSLFEEVALSPDFVEFLTIPGLRQLSRSDQLTAPGKT